MRLFWYYFTPILFFVSGYFFGREKKRRMLKPPKEIMLEPRTISGDQLEDAGASSSPTSPDRSDSGGQHEDAGVSSSLTSPEQSDSGPSTPSTSVIGSDYYIFLSFRGFDTRNGFIDQLYHRLNDVGLSFHPNSMLKDENDLPFSEATAANLISAITHSKVLIPVISPNYASSEWCLRELIHIMKCNEGRGHIVLPVLYKVEPKDVQHLQGSFGEAFRSHEHHFDEEVKQQGKEALTKAADSRVFESEKFANGREAELVKELVELVMSKQQEIFRPSLPMNLVGIDDHVAEVMKLVDPTYPETRTIGIYGIDGIGKTTLATIIYDKLSYKFESYSFLEDIKETVRQRGIEHVRSQLISDILKFNDHQMCDSHISSILSSFKEKKVLIVLDDVDQKDHLDYLIGDCSFMSGSRIIVTCQDKAILESEYRYELKEMNREDSLLLFSRHAFEGNTPPKELGTLSSDIVAITGGHPLALTVIGALHNSVANQRVPRDILKQLKDAHNTTIQQKLRISYDSLEYEEQQMFLDIACFFHGTDQRIATYLWDDLNFFPISGLAKMTERSLIKFDADNELKMHDRLKYLGRDITRQADKKPWCRSRLWDEEATTVLGREDENKNIEALRLDDNGSSEFVKQESFKRMPNMKFLHISAVDLAGDFKELLSELRWLKWERCPNSFEATNFHLEKLLIIDLSGGNISENWGGWSAIKMERLKVINLSWCSNLKSTPNLSTFKSLEMLLLNNCENLEEIDPSIGDVKHLVSLNLWACEKLHKLPEEMGMLEELKELNIDRTAIKEIPPRIGKILEMIDSRPSEKFAIWREGELVNELVETIMCKQEHDFQPHLSVDLIGIEDRVAEVMTLTDTNPFETQIIGIWGMGGIGKTTLAMIIYKKLFDKFMCRSFLKDIRETTKSKGVEYVQSLLISDITKNEKSRVCDSETRIRMIQSSCEMNKVLILLDDVDHRDHLDKLIGGCNFKSGSRIIITCRDKALLKSEYKSYELREMNSEDSMLLFSLYAFEAKQPPTELATLSSHIVATTGGLPLTLEIIGSFLKRKDESIWRKTLEELRKVSHTNVQEMLNISYYSLGYKEQQMFLDIACFFIGTDKRIAIYLWDDLQLYPNLGLARMIELSLIKYDDNNKLRMHDQLRDLGRAIARPSYKKPWDCSRLWDEEALQILRHEEINENIQALRLEFRGSKELGEPENFTRMPNLKFLHVSNFDFEGDFKDSLSELRWLEWESCPNSFKATNLHLEKLVILDLSGGDINENWGGWSSIKMERLKVLNLSHCIDLVRTPNLSACKSLEILILEHCHNLEEIDPSIGNVKCLISLNLRECHHLKKLPSQLGKLRGLVSLNLAYCTELLKLPEEMGGLENLKELTMNGLKIEKIPRSIGFLKKLETLNAQRTSLIGLPNSISRLVNLSTLDLRFCRKFEGFPKSIGSLVKLQHLLLGNKIRTSENDWGFGWNSTDSFCFHRIPHSIGKLESLTELYLTCTEISKLPKSIGKLKKLKILDIAGCRNLSSLPTTISKLAKLEELDATVCENLEGRVPINGLSSLKNLQLGKLDLLDMYNNDMLSLDYVDDLSFKDHLDLTYCNLPASLTVLKVTCDNRNLPQLSHLIHLKELSFQLCKCLESIPELPSGILNLWVVFCGELEALPSLLSLELLSELRIIGCSKLKKIEGLEGLKSLRGLFISECNKLPNLKGLEHLESLRQLEIEDLDASLINLFQVHYLGRLKNLERLLIARFQSLTRLDISELTHMRELLVLECKNVEEIQGLVRLQKLTDLNINGCKSIRKLPDLSLLDNLRQLDIRGCSSLQDVQGLERVKDVLR